MQNKETNQKLIKEIDDQIMELQKKRERLSTEMNRVHEDDKVNDYLHRYSGQDLLKNHTLDEEGLWEVVGEDPNCDFGGSHHQPHIGFVEGKLENVIKWAVHQNGFWQWGAGGNIKKVVDKQRAITKV